MGGDFGFWTSYRTLANSSGTWKRGHGQRAAKTKLVVIDSSIQGDPHPPGGME